jgi:putative copper export protein
MTPEVAAVILAGCRWLQYVSVLGLAGVAGAGFIVGRARSGPLAQLGPGFRANLNRIGFVMALLWASGLIATLAATVVNWFGPEALTDRERVSQMLVETSWGRSWTMAFAAAVVASVGFLVVRVVTQARAIVAVAAALAAVATTPMLGHAAGYGWSMWVAHAAHLSGSGLWLGTLLVLAWTSRSIWRDQSPGALRQLLVAFTPVALTGAAVAVGSGLWIAATHVWPPTALLGSEYGVILMLKLAGVALVAAAGWLNWRRFGPRVDTSVARRHLRRSAAFELTCGFVVVLLLTAWLAGLALPE